MATTIQEPNDVDMSELTPENIGNFAMIMYQKSQTEAGLKQLALGNLKKFLNYNNYKADNLATLIGFEKDSGTDNTKYDYDGDIPVPSETLKDQLQAVADQAGVTIHPSSGVTSLKDRIDSNDNDIEELQGYVKDGWTEGGTSHDGLLDRMASAESNISSLAEEIGQSAPGGETLTERVSAAEDDITTIQGQIGDTSTSGTILYDVNKNTNDIASINTEIGTDSPESGIKGRVKALETKVGDTDSGLVKDMSDVKSEITDITTDIGTDSTQDSIKGRIKDLENVVGDSNSGLVKDVADINAEIGSDFIEDKTITERIKTNEEDIAELKTTASSAYKFQGTVDSNSYSNWISGIGDFKNGYVWNALDKLTIVVNKRPSGTETITVNAGENFAFIEDKENYIYGYFDQLGTTIDISELETKVNELESRFSNTTGKWSSSGLNGTYLVCGAPIISSTVTNIAFIGTFQNGALTTQDVVDLSGNFANNFTKDATTNTVTANSAFNLNNFKIG